MNHIWITIMNHGWWIMAATWVCSSAECLVKYGDFMDKIGAHSWLRMVNTDLLNHGKYVLVGNLTQKSDLLTHWLVINHQLLTTVGGSQRLGQQQFRHCDD